METKSHDMSVELKLAQTQLQYEAQQRKKLEEDNKNLLNEITKSIQDKLQFQEKFEEMTLKLEQFETKHHKEQEDVNYKYQNIVQKLKEESSFLYFNIV